MVGRRQMQGMAEVAVSMAGELGVELDYSRESVAALEGVLGRVHDLASSGAIGGDLAGRMATGFGAYLGEVMLENDFGALGFRWGEDYDGEPILAGELVRGDTRIDKVLPITKCRKRVANGPQDSVVRLYAMLLSVAGGADMGEAYASLGADPSQAPREPSYLSGDRFDAGAACWLLSNDVVFFAPGDIVWDGARHEVRGLQVNGARVADVPALASDYSVLGKLLDLVRDLESDDALRVPLSAVHPGLHGALRGEDLTGATLFGLMACAHALMVEEPEPDRYRVVCDSRLPMGIPAFYDLVCRMVWDMRGHNGRAGAFAAAIANARNLDADQVLGDVPGPVPGATSEPVQLREVRERPEVSTGPGEATPQSDTPPRRSWSTAEREEAALRYMKDRKRSTARECAEGLEEFRRKGTGGPDVAAARRALNALAEKGKLAKSLSTPVVYRFRDPRKEAAEKLRQDREKAALGFVAANWTATAKELAASSELFVSSRTGKPSSSIARSVLEELVDGKRLERLDATPATYALPKASSAFRAASRRRDAQIAAWEERAHELQRAKEGTAARLAEAERHEESAAAALTFEAGELRRLEELRDVGLPQARSELEERRAEWLAVSGRAAEMEAERAGLSEERRALEEEMVKLGFLALSRRGEIKRRIAKIDARLSELEDELAALEPMRAACTEASARLASLESSVDRLAATEPEGRVAIARDAADQARRHTDSARSALAAAEKDLAEHLAADPRKSDGEGRYLAARDGERLHPSSAAGTSGKAGQDRASAGGSGIVSGGGGRPAAAEGYLRPTSGTWRSRRSKLVDRRSASFGPTSVASSWSGDTFGVRHSTTISVPEPDMTHRMDVDVEGPASAFDAANAFLARAHDAWRRRDFSGEFSFMLELKCGRLPFSAIGVVTSVERMDVDEVGAAIALLANANDAAPQLKVDGVIEMVYATAGGFRNTYLLSSPAGSRQLNVEQKAEGL